MNAEIRPPVLPRIARAAATDFPPKVVLQTSMNDNFMVVAMTANRTGARQFLHLATGTMEDPRVILKDVEVKGTLEVS